MKLVKEKTLGRGQEINKKVGVKDSFGQDLFGEFFLLLTGQQIPSETF